MPLRRFTHRRTLPMLPHHHCINPKPLGSPTSPIFNAVVKVDTDLAPLALLDFCQSLESAAKRTRLRHWGERSLDVDVLLYGDDTINNARLVVPHEGLFARNFVLIPMLELDPTLMVNGQKLADLPTSQQWQGLEKLTGV